MHAGQLGYFCSCFSSALMALLIVGTWSFSANRFSRQTDAEFFESPVDETPVIGQRFLRRCDQPAFKLHLRPADVHTHFAQQFWIGLGFAGRR